MRLAVQAQGVEVTTVEGLALKGEYHPVQQAFHEQHGLQCGFCTPGFLMAVCELLKEHPQSTDDDIRHSLSGNICHCTSYQQILTAVKSVAEWMATGMEGGTTT